MYCKPDEGEGENSFKKLLEENAIHDCDPTKAPREYWFMNIHHRITEEAEFGDVIVPMMAYLVQYFMQIIKLYT